MAKPIEFPEQTVILDGSRANAADLPVFRDGGQFISCWRLSPSEMIEVMNTGVVWARVLGETTPAISIEGQYPFEKAIN